MVVSEVCACHQVGPFVGLIVDVPGSRGEGRGGEGRGGEGRGGEGRGGEGRGGEGRGGDSLYTF